MTLEELRKEARRMGVPEIEVERVQRREPTPEETGRLVTLWGDASRVWTTQMSDLTGAYRSVTREARDAIEAQRLTALIKARPFVEVFDWKGRPAWVDALPGMEDVIDPYYVILWRGLPYNGEQRVGCAMADAEQMAKEVFDTGCPWYTWVSEPVKGQGAACVAPTIPCDVVVVVTNS